jgi:hypothetical protein
LVKINSNIFGAIAIIVTVLFNAIIVLNIVATMKESNIGVSCILIAASLFNAFLIIRYFTKLPLLFLNDNTLVVKKILAPPLIIHLRNIRSLKEKTGFSFIRKGDANKKIYVLNYRVEGNDYQITFADTFSDGSKVAKMADRIKSENPYFVFHPNSV